MASRSRGEGRHAASTCTPPVRVAIAFPGGFEFGGIGRVMLYTTDAWDKMASAPVWRTVDARGTGPVWLLPLHLARACMWIAGRTLAGQLDVLHLNVAGRGSTIRKIVLSELAGVLGLATVVHLHDYDYRQDLARRRHWTRHLVRRMFDRARAVIVLGERDRSIVEHELGIPPARVVVLANAVPDPGSPPERAGRSEPVRIIFLGHLDNRKGVPELLQALATPELRRRRWVLHLAGGGEVGRFRAEAARLGLLERTTFLGWLPPASVAELCRAADVFVLPSHAEGQAMALLEAMAHGLAIVTTPVGAHLEAVRPGAEALLVPPGNVPDLGAALCRLIDDGEFRARLGVAARARYCASFTIDRYAARVAQLYAAVLAVADVPAAAVARLSGSRRA